MTSPEIGHPADQHHRPANCCNPVRKPGPVSMDHVLAALGETKDERESRIRSLFSFFDTSNAGYLDSAQIEIAGDGIDPRKQTFLFCHKPIKRRKTNSQTQNASHVHSFMLDSEGAKCDTYSPNTTCVSSGTGVSFAEPDSVQSVPVNPCATC